MTERVGLFPLNTVLFPGGPLPLQVFEARYLDLVSDCMRREVPFGVCRIVRGAEIGAAAETEAVGTLARIIGWDAGADGVLRIMACGVQRFRIRAREVQANQLITAEIERLPEPGPCAVPAGFEGLVELAEEGVERLRQYYAALPKRPDDADWVGCRLAEILPFELDQRQQLLEIDDPIERLRVIRDWVDTDR